MSHNKQPFLVNTLHLISPPPLRRRIGADASERECYLLSLPTSSI